MADRLVTGSRKGYDGDILALCNPLEPWSPRFKTDAMKEIENGINNYYIKSDDKLIEVKVILKKGSKYLMAIDQTTNKNILDILLNC